MIWYKVWYKITAIILSNHPVSGDLVPYSNKSHPSTHRNLTTSKKGLKVRFFLCYCEADNLSWKYENKQ